MKKKQNFKICEKKLNLIKIIYIYKCSCSTKSDVWMKTILVWVIFPVWNALFLTVRALRVPFVTLESDKCLE